MKKLSYIIAAALIMFAIPAQAVNYAKSELQVNGLNVNTVAETVTAAKVLTNADNGKVFILNAAAGVAVTLPAPKAGLKYTFVIGANFATSNWVVGTNAAAAVIQGTMLVAGAAVPGVNEKQINFVNSAEALGDYAYVVSDGTNWFVFGVGNTAGSITLTAP